MPEVDEKIYEPYKIDEVREAGENLKKRRIISKYK